MLVFKGNCFHLTPVVNSQLPFVKRKEEILPNEISFQKHPLGQMTVMWNLISQVTLCLNSNTKKLSKVKQRFTK